MRDAYSRTARVRRRCKMALMIMPKQKTGNNPDTSIHMAMEFSMMRSNMRQKLVIARA